MAGTLKDLKVWQEAVGLAADVIRTVRHTNRREIKVVAELLMSTGLGLADHIAEGFGRYTATEQRQFYRAARRDLLHLETQMAVALKADLIAPAHHEELVRRTHTVARLLGGYLVYLDRQIGDVTPATSATSAPSTAPPAPPSAATRGSANARAGSDR